MLTLPHAYRRPPNATASARWPVQARSTGRATTTRQSPMSARPFASIWSAASLRTAWAPAAMMALGVTGTFFSLWPQHPQYFLQRGQAGLNLFKGVIAQADEALCVGTGDDLGDGGLVGNQMAQLVVQTQHLIQAHPAFVSAEVAILTTSALAAMADAA